MGSPTSHDDLLQFNSLIDCLSSHGVNMIDTAINYRYQKSDRTIGAAISYLLEENKI
jgi:aryl-alcohol dehydrogenase-like predicted oxidoreductase